MKWHFVVIRTSIRLLNHTIEDDDHAIQELQASEEVANRSGIMIIDIGTV
jgi:hypothetical protein